MSPRWMLFRNPEDAADRIIRVPGLNARPRTLELAIQRAGTLDSFGGGGRWQTKEKWFAVARFYPTDDGLELHVPPEITEHLPVTRLEMMIRGEGLSSEAFAVVEWTDDPPEYGSPSSTVRNSEHQEPLPPTSPSNDPQRLPELLPTERELRRLNLVKRPIAVEQSGVVDNPRPAEPSRSAMASSPVEPPQPPPDEQRRAGERPRSLDPPRPLEPLLRIEPPRIIDKLSAVEQPRPLDPPPARSQPGPASETPATPEAEAGATLRWVYGMLMFVGTSLVLASIVRAHLAAATTIRMCGTLALLGASTAAARILTPNLPLARAWWFYAPLVILVLAALTEVVLVG